MKQQHWGTIKSFNRRFLMFTLLTGLVGSFMCVLSHYMMYLYVFYLMTLSGTGESFTSKSLSLGNDRELVRFMMVVQSISGGKACRLLLSGGHLAS